MPSGHSSPLLLGHLRILATSDVHTHVAGHDDLRNRPSPTLGLARLAPVIASERKSAKGPCLLLDNGDTLQGSPIGNTAVEMPLDENHPVCGPMSALGYDAMGLGNHDLDFGENYVRKVADHGAFPVLCANLDMPNSNISKFRVFERYVPCSDGEVRVLQIGVVSFLPMQTGDWVREKLSDGIKIGNPLACAERILPEIRAAGADLVIALAHTGFSDDGPIPVPENFAGQLARIEGIDALVTGHVHQCIPGSDLTQSSDLDQEKGSIFGIPVVMPGYAASHLGVIDLTLTYSDTSGWHVDAGRARLVPAEGQPAAPEITRLLREGQRLTEEKLRASVGQTARHLHSYFAFLCPDPAQGLVGQACLKALDRTDLPAEVASLPRLSIVAPALSGGRAGSDHYVDIPRGNISARAIEMLCPYQDTISARVMSGREIREWLERSVIAYTHLKDQNAVPRLTRLDMPGFNFDMFQGLSVVIDPRKPPRYDSTGRIIDGAARRVRSVSWNREPLDDDQDFLVAMSSYRANGGGRFPAMNPGQSVFRTGIELKSAVLSILDAETWQGTVQPDWHLHPDIKQSVYLDTSPEALSHLNEIYQYDPVPEIRTEDGFLRLRLTI